MELGDSFGPVETGRSIDNAKSAMTVNVTQDVHNTETILHHICDDICSKKLNLKTLSCGVEALAYGILK